MHSLARELAGEVVGAGIRQGYAGEKVQVLQVFTRSLERDVERAKVERPRQKATTIETRAARALSDGKAVRLLAPDADERIAIDREGGGPAVQLPSPCLLYTSPS